jgi:hypothetical protein
VFDRGIPWTELILRDRSMPNDLNVQLSQRVSVALVFLLLALSTFAAVRWGGALLVPLFALLFLQLSRYWVEATIPTESRSGVAWITLTVAAIVTFAFVHAMPALAMPLMLAYVLLFLRHRYAYRRGSRERRLTTLFFAAYFLGTVALVAAHLPKDPLIFACFAVLGLVIALNNQFYLFLAAKRGRLFALAAIPFHVLYHLYNGFSFAIGASRFVLRRATRQPVEALRGALPKQPDSAPR